MSKLVPVLALTLLGCASTVDTVHKFGLYNSDCEADLMDHGYVNGKKAGSYATQICTNNTPEAIAVGKQLVDGKYVDSLTHALDYTGYTQAQLQCAEKEWDAGAKSEHNRFFISEQCAPRNDSGPHVADHVEYDKNVACEGDAKQLCDGMKATTKIDACLRDHSDKLTPGCRDGLAKAAEKKRR